jgi:hypothetical protein
MKSIGRFNKANDRAAFEVALSIDEAKNALIEETKDLEPKEKVEVLDIFALCNQESKARNKVATKKKISGKTLHWSELIE